MRYFLVACLFAASIGPVSAAEKPKALDQLKGAGSSAGSPAVGEAKYVEAPVRVGDVAAPGDFAFCREGLRGAAARAPLLGSRVGFIPSKAARDAYWGHFRPWVAKEFPVGYYERTSWTGPLDYEFGSEPTQGQFNDWFAAIERATGKDFMSEKDLHDAYQALGDSMLEMLKLANFQEPTIERKHKELSAILKTFANATCSLGSPAYKDLQGQLDQQLEWELSKGMEYTRQAVRQSWEDSGQNFGAGE